MKNKNVFNLMINLAKFIFSEAEFNRFISYLKMKLFGNLRLFVEDKLEELETKVILYKQDAVLEAQIVKCRELDALVTNVYVDKLVSVP